MSSGENRRGCGCSLLAGCAAIFLAGLEGKPRIIRASEPRLSFWEFFDPFTTMAAAKVQRHLAAPKFVMR